MRLCALALVVLLAACGSGGTPDKPSADQIACALAGSADFSAQCGVDRVERNGTLFLVVHHPNGGFRRFEVLKDGRGLSVADGAHPGVVTIEGNFLEIRVGRDRYRFPYKAKSGAQKTTPAPQAAGTPVPCAMAGAKSYAQQCRLERDAGGLVLHHPDGGFRRFEVRGQRIVAADGADAADVSVEDGDVAVSVGADSYLVPQALLADAR